MKKFFSKTQEYNLRVSVELYDKLKLASEVYGFDKSEIVRKALRQFNKAKPDKLVEVFEIHEGSTNSGPHRLKFIIPEKLMEGKDNSMLRYVLSWYLGLEKHTYKKPELDIPDLIEDVHYEVVST